MKNGGEMHLGSMRKKDTIADMIGPTDRPYSKPVKGSTATVAGEVRGLLDLDIERINHDCSDPHHKPGDNFVSGGKVFYVDELGVHAFSEA